MCFKDRLKELMIENSLTQIKLANEIDFSQRTISMWLLGQTEPKEAALKRLANYFKCSIDYLVGREDDFGVLQPITAEEYAQGARYSKSISITADEEEVLDKIKEVFAEFGEEGKDLIIDFCNVLLKQKSKK